MTITDYMKILADINLSIIQLITAPKYKHRAI